MEFHIAAEGDRRQAPMCSMAIFKAENLRSEAKRKKSVNFDAAPAADQKMAEFVEKHHEAQEEKGKENRVGDQLQILKD
jgi:hypothetical protein